MDNNTTFLIDLMKNSMNISCCRFDGSFQFVSSNSDTDLSVIFLTGSGSLPALQKHFSETDGPAILGARLGVLWLAVRSPQDDQFCVFGPVLSSEISVKTSEVHLSGYDMPMALKHRMIDYFKELPVISFNVLHQFARMISYAFSGRNPSDADIAVLGSLSDEPDPQDAGSSAPKKDRMTVWLYEQQLMKHIEEGDLGYRPALINARGISYGVKMNVGDPLRQMKTSTITFTSLAVRAAIRGGLTPEMAYTTGDAYIERLEKSTSFAELTAISNEMYEDFIRKVHDARTGPRYSMEIQSCCDYISLHLDEKLSLPDIAEQIGYSEYYMTRKFRRETGMSMTDFINRKKVRRAETLLTSTDLTVRQIAERLAFSSETYFSTVFAKINGTSPSKYRAEHLPGK